MYCPNCGKEVNEDQLFCSNCGTDLKSDNTIQEQKQEEKIETVSNTKQNNNSSENKTIINILIYVLVSIVLIGIIGTLIYFINQPKKISLNCENAQVKSLVVQIFEENDKYYKAIDKSSIASVKLIYPAIQKYDETIDKYFCSGTILMKSTNTGFMPKSDESNDYYYLTQLYFSDLMTRYDTYKINVTYTSQMSEGSPLVTLSTSNLSKSDYFQTESGSNEIKDKFKAKRQAEYEAEQAKLEAEYEAERKKREAAYKMQQEKQRYLDQQKTYNNEAENALF